MSETKVIQGTKIEEDEARKLDQSKMGISISGAPLQAEVEGQYVYMGYTQCPWCGNIGRSMIDSERYEWYRCGNCGSGFRA